MTLLPLPIHPAPTEAQSQAIRDAKAALALPFQVQIVPAVPGGYARVLALGTAPPWLCDYALVTNPANLQAALAWVLSDDVDPRASLVIDQLRSVFGSEVTEIEIPVEPREGVYFD
jgi:hypothetical protein